jgi:4-hydroxybenzoate polyprenyltransferase
MSSDPQSWTEISEWTVGSNNRVTKWLVGSSEQLWNVLIYSSTYMATIATLEVLLVMYLLTLPLNPAPLVVGFVTFTIYATDRIVDIESDAVSYPQRTAFVRRHRRLLSGLAAIAYGLAVALAAYGGPMALGLTLFPAIIWVLYAVDWAPTNVIPFRRMKEILVVNSALIALAWAVTVVFLPVMFAKAPVTPTVGILFVYFTIGAFLGTEIANVRDIESDRNEGVSTLPSTLGVKQTRFVLYGIALIGIGILGWAWVSGYMGWIAVVALSLGLLYLLGIVSLLGRIDDTHLLTVAGECGRLPVLAALGVASLAI